jgi:Flp pilus assembly protein TadB
VRNPLGSEAEAFRFLGVVIVGAAVIIGAAFINTWVGVAVAVIAFAALARWLMQEPQR